METVETIKSERISVADWLITIIITAIPLVGIIMLFVWAFSNDTNPTKSNWAKATLIIMAAAILLSIIFMAIFGAAFFGMMEQDMMNATEY